MSGSYRLEAPRSRQIPSPLQFEHSSFNSTSSVLSSHHNSQTLLYDLPSAPSVSPPTSPKSPRLISPTSPSSPRSRTPRIVTRPSTPLSGRNRSITPLGVTPSELEMFAEYCRAWYYNQDDNSGRLMTQTLATLPSSQRAPYSRLQASIRSAYHRSVNARRTAEFRAHLSATQPGASLMPHSRADPHGSLARKERYERFERFVRSWCTMGMPGPQPFFQALWAIMRLQVVPENLGGAGRNRIEWEFDDAVFKEAAGKDFMLEAIDILKGVLAFEERPSSKRCSTGHSYDLSPTIAHSRSRSQPLLSERKPLTTASAMQPKRARAPSDPFLDTPALSRSVGSTSTQSSGNTTAFLSSMASDGEEPPSPDSTFVDELLPPSQLEFDDCEEEFLRIWTSSDLTNPEYLDLLKAFPSFIARRPLPRFPAPPSEGDIEEAFEANTEGRHLRFGTGSMWVTLRPRSDGWEGSWWSRFCLWWRKVFC